MSALPREAVSTAWYTREAVRKRPIGDEFTSEDIADDIAIGAKVDAGAVSSTLTDLSARGCIRAARKIGNRVVWQKIAEPPEIAQRKRKLVVPAPPEPVQAAMPLEAPPSDLAALRAKILDLAAYVGISFDIKEVPDANFWAEAARRSASRP